MCKTSSNMFCNVCVYEWVWFHLWFRMGQFIGSHAKICRKTLRKSKMLIAARIDWQQNAIIYGSLSTLWMFDLNHSNQFWQPLKTSNLSFRYFFSLLLLTFFLTSFCSLHTPYWYLPIFLFDTTQNMPECDLYFNYVLCTRQLSFSPVFNSQLCREHLLCVNNTM